ncbi:aminodeoxychorismate/anthranilate synthase component II [Oceanobacillus piezotolerans]|uniref:Aminodeoxychorismate/anthranilate synthase component II n=1 Tax=Oceanobacillus piezotolerans TaxID=2448030 RepID=A0A498DAN9_9BACI|nr:aminodeoxychorismate/anthranilate synthase component II [Oceanobacillus piezotolerans]RLL42048.1 aminodeoxychorismate/anthranilate synthase component II [Oceanobacillus piezotolerans]
MILLVDNYDSFTYNLYQYFSEEGAEVQVVRNDRITLEEIDVLKPEAIVISPGPKLPQQAGICIELVQRFHQQIPIFGICLGHQVIAEALGGKLRQATNIMHGKTSIIEHKGETLFELLPTNLEVMRYHSYVIDPVYLPDELEVTATAKDDREIMAIKHKKHPIYGVQFHPESIGTETGKNMIRNFIKEIRKEKVS